MAGYCIIRRACTGTYRVKGSKFYSRAYPAGNLQEIRNRLKNLQDEFSDATHICYAYRLMREDDMDEFSTDAGEPGGSAGRPILNVLRREELTNTVIFVIRYYGGTKLGIPGLIEAYGAAAADTVDEVTKYPWVPTVTYSLTHGYDQQRLVEMVIRQLNGKLVDQSFGEQITSRIRLRREVEEMFRNLISEKSSGLLIPKKSE